MNIVTLHAFNTLKILILAVLSQAGSVAAYDEWKVANISNHIYKHWNKHRRDKSKQSYNMEDFEVFIKDNYEFMPNFSDSLRIADASNSNVLKMSPPIARNLIALGIANVEFRT